MRIAFCLPGLYFTSGFLWAWTKTVLHMERQGVEILTSYAQCSNVTKARNMVLGENKLLDGEPYDYMMWIDSDTVWKPEHIDELILADKDIISGLVPIDDGNNFGVGHFRRNGRLESLNWSQPLALAPMEVGYAGFAFLLVKPGIFEQLGYPYFMQTPLMVEGTDQPTLYGEDVEWCLRVKQLGFKIWAHPSVVLGHEKTMTLKVRPWTG